MRPDDWQLTYDIDSFLALTEDFLCSRPALHNMLLTGIEKLRTSGADACGEEATLFGRLESGGEVRAIFFRTPCGRLTPSPLSAEQADSLADVLAGFRHVPSSVVADHETATAFAERWRHHTGAETVPFWRTHLYRLDALTPPEPRPEGRGRVAGEEDHELVVRWCREFCVEVGEQPSIDLIDAGSWADSRFGDRHFTFWETPDGVPVSMAAATSMAGGVVRVDPVYTPVHFRGRGYAGAVTVEVSGAAPAAGATDVVLFADPANPTSNALYRRIGYVHVTDFSGYRFSAAAPETPCEHRRLIDGAELCAADLIGRRLLRVTTSWHRHPEDRPSLLHLWLHMEGLGPVQFHTSGTGLSLRADQPHEPYSMEQYGSVSVADDSPDVPVTRFVGQPIRSVREIRYRDGRVDFVAGYTLQFPGRSIRLLALDDELVLACDEHLGAVEGFLHEDSALARVVQTCGGFPSQWDAWTTGGQYLFLRYRNGEGTVEQHPSDDTDTWDGEGSRLWTSWYDGTDGGVIDLAGFLAMAGLRVAPGAEVPSTYLDGGPLQ